MLTGLPAPSTLVSPRECPRAPPPPWQRRSHFSVARRPEELHISPRDGFRQTAPESCPHGHQPRRLTHVRVELTHVRVERLGLCGKVFAEGRGAHGCVRRGSSQQAATQSPGRSVPFGRDLVFVVCDKRPAALLWGVIGGAQMGRLSPSCVG